MTTNDTHGCNLDGNDACDPVIGAAEPGSSRRFLELAMDGITVLAEHESQALSSHWQKLKIRWAVAQKARTVGELVRDQVDLLPDTREQLVRDHAVRSALVVGLQRDLKRAAMARLEAA